MLKSMTGYGRGEAQSKEHGMFVVDVQGLNRKYCDINIHLPHQLMVLESKMRKVIQGDVKRGRINVYLSLPAKLQKGGQVHIDTELVRDYFRSLKKLKKELKLSGELDLSLLSGLQEIINHPEPVLDPNKVWPAVDRALKSALKGFTQMRQKEGAATGKQIIEFLADIQKRLQKIEEMVPELIEHFRTRLGERIREVGISISDADERVQKEVAILAEHIDITEELNRSKSHLEAFRSLMKKDETVGRTLDFLIQEMMREVNTMGSKAVHTAISTHVVYIKGQLEKIREQIQNIE